MLSVDGKCYAQTLAEAKQRAEQRQQKEEKKKKRKGGWKNNLERGIDSAMSGVWNISEFA